MARIMWLPDLHCSYNDGRVADGVPARFQDWSAASQKVVDLAKRIKPDLVIAPGDFFVHQRPSWREIGAVWHLFQQLETLGIKVIGMTGNHDVGAPGDPGPVDGLAQLANRPLWGLTTPQVVTVRVGEPFPIGGGQEETIQVAVLPWVKASAAMIQDSEGTGDAIMRTTAALVDIIRALAAQIDPRYPAVLAGHWGIATCKTANERIMTGQEATIPLGEIADLPFRAIGMGHIHTPQVFPQSETGPVIFHTGALERRDFGEEKDERRVAVTDTITRSIEWFDLPVRRFLTRHLSEQAVNRLAGFPFAQNVTPEGKGSAADELALELPYGEAAHGAICRVVYKATEEQHKLIDQGALIQALKDAGAEHVAGVFPEILRADRSRAVGLTEHSSPHEAARTWLALQQDVSEGMRDQISVAFADLLAVVGIQKGG